MCCSATDSAERAEMTSFPTTPYSNKLTLQLCLRLPLAAFTALDTTDFEVVIRALKQAATLLAVYLKDNPSIGQAFEADAKGLRELLAQTIAASHPDRPADIENARYAACKTFLKNFKSIYTLNYDLLLYWR